MRGSLLDSIGSQTKAPRRTEPLEHEAEPIDWRPRAPLKKRIVRAVAAPVTVASIVFVAVVLISIMLVVFRADTPEFSGESAAPDEFLSRPAEMVVTDDTSAAQDARPAQPTIFVHVVGEVVAPGVFELAAGSRVSDAIKAAGGATPAAELTGVNLARKLGDGEQILVPNADQIANLATAQLPAGPGLVNLNTADLATLETLPGVGPALAQRIVSWRQAHGPFVDVEQLLDVSGIGSKTIEPLRARVTV